MHLQPRNPTPETELPSHLRASPDFQSFACTAIDVPHTPAAVALSAVAAAATIPRAIDTPPVASTESCVSAATEDETSARVSRSSSASQISAVDSIQAAATTAPQQAAASTTAPPPMSEQNLGHIDATAEGFKSLEPTPINSPADTSKLHPNGQASLGASPLLPPPDRSITSHPTSDQNDRLSRGSQHGHGPGHHQSFRQSESPRQLAHPNTPRRNAQQPFSGSASLPGTSAIGIPALAPATNPGTLQNIAHAPSHAPCLHPLAFSPPGIALAPAPTRGHQHHHGLLSRAQGGYHLGTQYTQHPVTHMLPTVVTPGSGNPPLMASSPSLVPVHHQGALGYCFTYPEYDRFVSEHLTHQHYQHFGYPMQPVYAYDQQGVFQAAGYAPALPDGVYGYPSACAPLFNLPPPSTDLYPSAPMVVSPHALAGGLSSPPGVVSPHPPNGNGNGNGNGDQCFFGGNGGAQHVENQHGQYAQHHHNYQHAQQRQRQQQQQLAVPRGKPSRGHPPTVPLDLAKKEPVDEYFVAAKRDAQAVNPEVEEPKSAVLERYKKENRDRGGCGGGTCTQAQERRKGKGKQHGKEHGKEHSKEYSKEHEANFILPTMDELREHVIAFARDQEGTKMLDAWLIRAPPSQLAEALQELKPRLRSLTTDVFGNYTVQTLIRCGGEDVAEEIFDLAIADRVLSLSLHVYGCRVVQAALDVLPRQHRLSMAKEVAPYVLSCAADEQANHVVQKCLEAVQPTEGGAERMALSIAKNALALSKHPFGCRLVQRVLEYCTNDALVEEVVASLMPLALELATHAFGNYVMQEIVKHGSNSARDGFLEAVLKDPLTVRMLACDSIASNVMDTCVEACGEPHLEALARALMHPLPSSATTADNAGASTPLVLLACDPYGNHVLQRVLARVQNGEREMLLEVLRPHVAELKNNDFGRHVARKLEQLF